MHPLLAEHEVLRGLLLDWYDSRRRDLPWRTAPTLYGTWISEIMLQQTTVATVTPRWHAFLERFPDVAALAAADEAQVLDAWAGLGYYRRARQLHAAARAIVESGGDLPRSREDWLALPGIGTYTAGAVASIGLGIPVPAVDTNVVRVLTRLACGSPGEAKAFPRRELDALAADLVSPDRPGDWNQALMDLGAGPCAPSAPRCDACPLADACRAAQSGDPGAIPPPRPRVKPVRARWSLLVVDGANGPIVAGPGFTSAAPAADDDVRDRYDTLYRGYRTFPHTRWTSAEATWNPAVLWRDWWNSAGGRWVSEPESVGEFGHAITRYRLTCHVCRGTVETPPERVLSALALEVGPCGPLSPPSRRAEGLVTGSP